MTGWATVEDVQAITGATVDDSLIQQATFVIELTSGGRVAALDATTVSGRNLYFLKAAVAYQAAWMAEQPDYFSRSDVSSVTQDGSSANYRPDGLVLSPLARRCLKRLSWRGMRSIQVGSHTGIARGSILTADDYDDGRPWQAL